MYLIFDARCALWRDRDYRCARARAQNIGPAATSSVVITKSVLINFAIIEKPAGLARGEINHFVRFSVSLSLPRARERLFLSLVDKLISGRTLTGRPCRESEKRRFPRRSSYIRVYIHIYIHITRSAFQSK